MFGSRCSQLCSKAVQKYSLGTRTAFRSQSNIKYSAMPREHTLISDMMQGKAVDIAFNLMLIAPGPALLFMDNKSKYGCSIIFDGVLRLKTVLSFRPYSERLLS
jgi:hypothetical protein